MKLLVDFLPIFIFFLVYKFAPEFVELCNGILPLAWVEWMTQAPAILIATAVLIPATIVQIFYTYLATGKIENMHIATLVLVILLGGATLFYQDKAFIQWKPTLVNWLFALIFLGSRFVGEKTIIQRMLGESLELPLLVWHKLNFAWIGFFFFSGVANIYVAYNFSENTWVNFKMFGMLGLTFVFIILQSIFLIQHMPRDEQD